MGELAVRTLGLTKYYRGPFFRLMEHPALVDLNLEVERGSVYGFLGPNGAGKTTTIRCLMDLIRPTRGEAWVLGVSCRNVQIRERVGYLPDGPVFASYLKAEQFLMLCARLLRIPRADRQKRVGEVLEVVRMTQHAREGLGTFSRGMIQRIGIAQVLLNRPDLIILDEPLVGLDPEGRRDLLRILREQRDRGVAVFFCSHVLAEVEKLCDSVGILCRGRLLCSGPLNQLLEAKGLYVRVPPDQPQVAHDLMDLADASQREGDGTWQLEFHTAAKVDELRQRTFPEGVTLVPRRESLEEFFFRLTESKGVAETKPAGGTEQGKDTTPA